MSSKKHSKKSTKKHRTHSGRPESLIGVRPDKRLGQNFLVDEETIERIVSECGASKDSLVIEIGPGTGALTLPLAERAGRVICIELDEKMAQGLRVKTFASGNVEIIEGDILETDLKKIAGDALEEYGLKNYCIVGNLPYYITTPILLKLLNDGLAAESITVMMQKEVADRIAAEPGTRASGAITYSVHYHAKVREVAYVPRECFYPVPGVDSAVLRLDLRDEPPIQVKDKDMLFRCIKAGFSMRRKTLLNALTALDGYTKEMLSDALSNAGIEATRRAESLTLEEFAALSDSLQEAKACEKR